MKTNAVDLFGQLWCDNSATTRNDRFKNRETNTGATIYVSLCDAQKNSTEVQNERTDLSSLLTSSFVSYRTHGKRLVFFMKTRPFEFHLWTILPPRRISIHKEERRKILEREIRKQKVTEKDSPIMTTKEEYEELWNENANKYKKGQIERKDLMMRNHLFETPLLSLEWFEAYCRREDPARIERIAKEYDCELFANYCTLEVTNQRPSLVHPKRSLMHRHHFSFLPHRYSPWILPLRWHEWFIFQKIKNKK